YAIWSTSAGTPSSSPLLADVAAVPLAPTALTLQASHTQLPYGVPVTLAGVVTRAGLATPSQPVDLYGVDGGTSTAVLLRHLTSDADGKVRTTLRPYRTLALTLRFAGDAFSNPSTSQAVTVQVLPRIGAALSPATIKRGETSVLSGRVAPVYKSARVLLQLFSNHAWRNQQETRTSDTGGYSFSLSPRTGAYAYRALLSGTAAWVAAGSPVANLTVTARDLALGAKGDDVLALQRALAKLHYDSGAQDGVFGQNLKHAVIAFQKLEGLSRTGTWTKAERTRLGRPTSYKVRYPASGYAVEVSITRQIVVLTKGGVVQRVIDTSTGGEYTYTDQGVSYVAHTPRGSFRIQHKIDGVRTSRLGYLYRPSYFFQGYAVHGEAYDVPTHPASHGCVRVTNYNADILFPLLTVGVPVHIFDE
ncbi:MAG: hypothetical protein JWO12_3374, partial [Frankiales bacterium]|nr:hypothetical protein [Frankiales bacterium]